MGTLTDNRLVPIDTDDPISAYLRDYCLKRDGKFDRQGNLISHLRWAGLLTEPGYMKIADTPVYASMGYRKVNVSTIWTGTYPGLFETMVFKQPYGVYCGGKYDTYYDTEEDAIKGHRATVMKVMLHG